MGDSIELGVEFYVHHFRRGKNIIRFSTTPKVGREQSVAEHTNDVVYLSIFIADILFKNKEVDYHKLVRKALYHDTVEIFTGDIVKPFKVYSGKKFKQSLNNIENKLMSEIESYFKVKIEYIDDDIESDIVLLADIVEALCFVYEQIKMGNKFFTTHSINMLKTIKAIIEKYIDKYGISSVDAKVFESCIMNSSNNTGKSTEIILFLGNKKDGSI